jgi:carboxymethylenebutenolidase
MKAAGKQYEPVTYDGAGHGFMRAGEDPANTNPANKTAHDQAFARLVKALHEMKRTSASSSGAEERRSARKAVAQAIACHDAGAASAVPAM